MKVQFFYGYSILVLGMAVLLVSCEAPTSRSQSFQSSSSPPGPPPSKAWVVDTLAGSTAGFAGGTGNSAQFYHPTGVAVDSDGNVYVVDRYNHRIRKITAGVVSTPAGSTAGFAEGTGAEAQFHYPVGVVLDSSGNVYVGDWGNHRIRKITAGVVSTIAGTGVAGSANGDSLTEAQFHGPHGVAMDSSGNIYVADTGNHRIRKITADGEVSTIAGSTAGFAEGTGTEAQFHTPIGVAVDTDGNVYVADTHNHRIRKITADGVVSTIAGSGTAGFAEGIGTEAQFQYPHGVALDSSGNIYVADTHNHRIRKITADGVVSTIAGSGTAGSANGNPLTEAQFNAPYTMAVDSAGTVYVADLNNHRIRKLEYRVP